MAPESKNPPRNKKMSGSPYWSVTSPADDTPVKGNSTMGSSAVAGIGIASVIHQMAIHAVVAAAARPGPSSVGNTGNNKGTKKAIGPSQRPTVFIRDFTEDILCRTFCDEKPSPSSIAACVASLRRTRCAAFEDGWMRRPVIAQILRGLHSYPALEPRDHREYIRCDKL